MTGNILTFIQECRKTCRPIHPRVCDTNASGTRDESLCTLGFSGYFGKNFNLIVSHLCVYFSSANYLC